MNKEIQYSAKYTIPAFCVLYFFIGVMQLLGNAYVPLYYNSLDFTDSLNVGLLMSLSHIVTGVGQTVWGNLADKSRTKNRILYILLVGVFISSWLVILPRYSSVATLIPSVIAFNLFILIPLSIFDAVVVENIDKYGFRFGAVRGFVSGGSAGSTFLLFVIGIFTAISPKAIFIAISCAAIFGVIPLRFVPPSLGYSYGHRGGRLREFALLMKNKRFVLLLYFGLIHFTCTGAYATYYSIYFTSEEGLGASMTLLFLFSALCTANESALTLVGNKIFMKISIYQVLILISFAGALRAMTAFLAPNPFVLLIGGVFQALMFAPLWTQVPPYIGSIMRDGARATGQAVWSNIIMGVGPALGSAISGFVSRAIGLRSLFLVVACMHVLTVLVFLVPFRAQRATDIREGFITEVAVK